jgi:hypothetical protein
MSRSSAVTGQRGQDVHHYLMGLSSKIHNSLYSSISSVAASQWRHESSGGRYWVDSMRGTPYQTNE